MEVLSRYLDTIVLIPLKKKKKKTMASIPFDTMRAKSTYTNDQQNIPTLHPNRKKPLPKPTVLSSWSLRFATKSVTNSVASLLSRKLILATLE